MYLCLRCGITIFIYINDIFTIAKSYEQALFKLFILDVLGRAGLVINLDKGQMPTLAAVYFGFVVDSRSMRIYLPEKKIEMILGKFLVFMKTS